MEEIVLTKGPGLTLIPVNENEDEKVAAFKVGEPVRCKCTRMKERNYQFFKKWWDLVLFAYDNWEPGENNIYNGQVVQKSKETFRKEVTILAGHYEVVCGVNGVKKVAKSISFGAMSEAEFAQFYSATVDAILKHFLDNYEENDQEVFKLIVAKGRMGSKGAEIVNFDKRYTRFRDNERD